MRDRESTHPFVFFFLVLPYGISSGFVSITLPFILTRVGFSVALAASIVAIGVSANLWRFLWGPVADLTLTARRWYLLGLGTSAATLVIAGSGLALAMLASAAAIYFACDVRIVSTETLGERMRILWRDILSMVRSAIPLFTIVLVCSPIGAGAMNNLWSAVAPDWKATPNQVALISGVLNGVLSAVGCVIDGWVADRVGRWWAYFGSGILIAMVAIIMAVAPRTPNAFTVGVLAYALTCGMAYAAFSAIVLLAIGRGAASTKYATLSSLGNLPIVYMTASDGWVHDRFGTAWMLHSEALIAIICIVLGLALLRWINPPRRSDLVLP